MPALPETTSNNKRVRVIQNPDYVKDGLKAYGSALVKFNIKPPKDGPFFTETHVKKTKKFCFFTKTEREQVLAKKNDATGEKGQVGADDIQKDSYYICPVTIGTPGKTLLLDFDSGSSDLWVWSSELPEKVKEQGQNSGHVIYDQSQSSTAKNLQGYTWQIQYGDGSSASGDVCTDTIDIGGLTITDQGIEKAKQLSASFRKNKSDGLLGLAFANINTVKPKHVKTPVRNLINQHVIDQRLFTVHLSSYRDSNEVGVGGDSFYTFGFIDKDAVKEAGGGDPHYAPVDNSQGFWQFASESASINGKTIKENGGTAIADTGTTLALVSDQVVTAVYKAIPGAHYDFLNQGYVFPASTSTDDFPVVKFAVGGQEFAVNKEDLAYANAGNGMVYGGIQSRGTLPFSILGDTFLKSVYAIFDLGNKQFGVYQR